MESEKTIETKTASTTTDSPSEKALSSAEKAPSSAAPIGIYIFLFFIVCRYEVLSVSI